MLTGNQRQGNGMQEKNETAACSQTHPGLR